MSGFRGFGFTITAGGVARYWFTRDGVRRWIDTDEPCDDFQAAMQRGIPPIGTPDPIAADESEHGLCALPELSAEQMAEGNEYQKDCR